MNVIEKAVKAIMTDGLVVYPTETIYGLGADAFSEDAILKVYEAKNRSLSMPLSIAVSDLDMMAAVTQIGPQEEEFINRFLPGPVTVIVKARSYLPAMLTVGTGMIGIRYPAHPVAIDLISRFDSPITATSANQSGAKDPVTPGECHIPYDILIDGGILPGTSSTVVDLVNHCIIREGALIGEVRDYLSKME
jgi:L-threonylcarbamoyladenylate synthase